MVPIKTPGDPSPRLRRVELRDMNVLPGDRRPLRREEDIDTVPELPARGNGAADKTRTPGLRRYAGPVHSPSLFQDEVHDGEHGAGAVKGRARALDDLDPLDRAEVQTQVRTDGRRAIDALIQGMSVDLDKNAVGVVARTPESADPEVGIVPIIGEKQARYRIQSLGQRPVSVPPDLLFGNDRNGGRRFLEGLEIPGGGADLHIQEGRQGIVLLGRVLCADPGGDEKERDQQDRGQRRPGSRGPDAAE